MKQQKKNQKFYVGDLVEEYDRSTDEVVDVLFITYADHFNGEPVDEEDFTDYYSFYSLNEEEIWEYTELKNGSFIEYRKIPV